MIFIFWEKVQTGGDRRHKKNALEFFIFLLHDKDNFEEILNSEMYWRQFGANRRIAKLHIK
jgi:hypothetical protein